ncbi:MAG: hypothetical protein ACSLFP_15260 [Acidimicrobiales bacterium]
MAAGVRRWATAATLGLALVLAGCGDDGGDGDAGASGDPTDTTVGDDTSTCAETDLTLTNRASGTSFDASSTAAVSLEGGAAFTAYAADFDLELDDISLFSSPEVPADGNLATIAVTVFNSEEELDPLEAGQVVTHDTSEFGILTFVVTANAGEELYGNNLGGEGELTITAVGDRFCAEIDYRDDEKELTGTLSAPVKDL